MSNLMIRFVGIFVISMTLTVCNKAATGEDGVQCAVSAIGQEKVVRVHNEQKRFFVVDSTIDQTTFAKVVARVDSCLATSDWAEKWSMSVFSDKKLAGYKDEPGIVKYHEGDQWARGYLGEYDSGTGVLTLEPAWSPATIKIK